jgi:pSer/pThr/pTyr-binding forkhead associated (FHA) protein
MHDDWTPALDAAEAAVVSSVGSETGERAVAPTDAPGGVPAVPLVEVREGTEAAPAPVDDGLDDVPIFADEELSAVERTGGQLPFDVELANDRVLVDDDDEGGALPEVLSSLGASEPGDRTAAYDPPEELFAQVPDPEAQPVPAGFHALSTAFLPAVRASAPAPAPVVATSPASVEIDDALLDATETGVAEQPELRRPASAPAPQLTPAFESGRAETPPTHAREVPAPAPKPPRQDPGRAAPRREGRPAGPMHRRREPTPAPAPPPPAPDPVENEMTGIYEPPVAVPELPRARLTITEGENRGKAYFLNRNHTSVGRGIDNDIVLMDLSVSRRHFRVDRHGEGFRLVDLGSGNGTQVNGQRREDVELYDKDRIDLGNTSIEVTYMGRSRVRAPNAQQTDPRHVLTPPANAARVLTAQSSIGRLPWNWVGLWAAVAFCTVLLGMLALRELRRDRGPGDEAATRARDQLAVAESAMRVRAWGRAEEALTVARRLAPGLNLPYAEVQARIDRERTHSARLEDARTRRGSAAPAELIARLEQIPVDSVYHDEARSLLTELRQLPAEASGSAAPLPSTEAPRVENRPSAPAEPRVVADSPRVSASNDAGGEGEASKRIKSEVADALKLYREEKFSEAVLALERAAKRSPTSKAGTDAKNKARAVRQFADDWTAAEKAVKARRAREASDALARAGATDRKLGGLFRDRIDQQLAEQSYFVAIQAYNRQAYDEAIDANTRVMQLAPGHQLAMRLQEKMRRNAPTILRQGHRALADGDKDVAQRIARAVMKLVPRDDPNQQAARDLLGRAGG